MMAVTVPALDRCSWESLLCISSWWLYLTLVTNSIPGNWFRHQEASSHYHKIIRYVSVPLYECSHGCIVIACPFCICLQPRGLPAVATRMSSSAEWTVCVFLCDGAVMETQTAWTWATRRTARASHTCVTLPSSLPARTPVSSRLAVLNVLTHISATIIKKCQDRSKD